MEEEQEILEDEEFVVAVSDGPEVYEENELLKE